MPSAASAGPRCADGRRAPPGPGPRRRRATVTSTWVEPIRDFSSVAVPSAMTRPWSMTTMLSASRSASSRYCVVSSTVVPSATSSSMTLPEAEARRRVEPGRRLVEEQDRRPVHERGREVEPAAHAARVGLERPVGGVGQAEALEQLGRPVLRQPLRAGGSARPTRRRFSRPVSTSSTAAYCPARPIRSRTDCGCFADVDAEHRRAPLLEREDGREDADRRRLAGAVGAEQPEHGAGLDARRTRRRARRPRRTACGRLPPRWLCRSCARSLHRSLESFKLFVAQ